MWDSEAIVPVTLCKYILIELHSSHLEIVIKTHFLDAIFAFRLYELFL